MNIWTSRVFWSWTILSSVILGVFIVGSTVRSPWFRKPPKPIGDGLCYECIAFSLYSGGGFRENYADPNWRVLYEGLPEYSDFLKSVEGRDLPATGRPPLYPLALALVYSVFGRGPEAFMAIRIFSAICLALAGGLATALTRCLLLQRTQSAWIGSLGSLATLAFAASQRTMQDYTTDFLTEPLALLLTQLAIVLLVSTAILGEKKQDQCKTDVAAQLGLRWAVGCGVILGLMVLARSLFVTWLPGLLLLHFLSTRGNYWQRMRGVSIVAITVLVICLPWWIHNCVALSRFMPLGTQGPVAMAGGNCDEAFEDGGNWSHVPELRIRRELLEREDFLAATQIEGELMVVEQAKKEVREWTANHWTQLPTLAWRRAASHWNPYTGRALLWKFAIVVGLIWTAINLGQTRWWLIGLPVLSTLVTMLLYETGGRFLVPLYGLLFTLSGLGVCAIAMFLGRVIVGEKFIARSTRD